MKDNDWRSHAAKNRLPIETGREPLALSKYPKDLDFRKTIGGTTYAVKSHFDKSADESLLKIILRLFEEEKNLSE